MIRVLLLPLTAILITLAVILQNVWVYTAAGIAIAVGLLVLGLSFWEQYQQNQTASSSSQSPEEPSLSELGITEIRPKTSEKKPASPASNDETSSETASVPSRAAAENTAAEPAPPAESPEPATSSDREEKPNRTPRRSPDEQELFSFVSEKPLNYPVDELLEDYLRSLHASIRAHTVCVLGVNVYADSCSIEAAVSKNPHIEQENRISLEDHFLKNVSLEDPVTILIAEGDAPTIEELGYYSEPVDVAQVAVAPIEVSDDMIGYLLADRTPREAPIQTVYYTLLADFARLLGTILYAKMEDRPRREIISEEIERAHENNRSLALALIHPNNADAVLREGPESVAQTEYLLRQILEETTPNGRVERFGELIYGVFYYDTNGTIDTWAQKVQTAFIEQDEAVNIGIALYSDRHDTPEDLRSDAAEALRVAYDAGQNECIIFE
jgi:hypothetical protein